MPVEGIRREEHRSAAPRPRQDSSHAEVRAKDEAREDRRVESQETKDDGDEGRVSVRA